MQARMTSETFYEYEEEIVWEGDPSNLSCLRERIITTRKKDGIPERRRRRYIVYGYSNISQAAPTDSEGCIRKRMFYMKPTDPGGPEEDPNSWPGGNTPAEAVDIDTIQAGKTASSI